MSSPVRPTAPGDLPQTVSDFPTSIAESMLHALRTTQRSLEMWSVEEPADSEETREAHRIEMRQALRCMEEVIHHFERANGRST